MTQNSNPKKMQLYCIFTLNVSHRRSKHLTDIPRQREEYEVPYHFYSSSWSGISVLFYDKLTLHFCHKINQSYPTQTQQDVA